MEPTLHSGKIKDQSGTGPDRDSGVGQGAGFNRSSSESHRCVKRSPDLTTQEARQLDRKKTVVVDLASTSLASLRNPKYLEM